MSRIDLEYPVETPLVTRLAGFHARLVLSADRLLHVDPMLPNREDVVAALQVLKLGKKLRFNVEGRYVTVVHSSATQQYVIGVEDEERETVATMDEAVERAWHYIREGVPLKHDA